MPDLIVQLNDKLLGRYALERELGRGGMATVYLAEDLKHHRPVAIKVLDPELGALLGPERFLREIETAARLQHPHILPLLDSGAADGLLYYVMPYAEGESLRERLAREKQLPVEAALKLAREVADALDYAHRHDIVHRDIKPENILLQDGHAVVADFGIARAVGLAGGAKLTETGAVLGTPAYLSPEQAMGGRELDGRSDLYSLGCVLYEMLAGQPPFTGTTGEALIHQHLTLEPRPVTALRPAVPAEVAHALAKTLAKAPADRFETAAQLAAALAPTAPSREGEVRKPRRRAPMIVGAAAVAIAIAGFVMWKSGAIEGLLRQREASPPLKDWVLVAAFDGPADDSSLAGATRDLVSAALDQSQIVATVPDDQIKLALERAGKPANTRVDAGLAHELAYRRAIRAVVEGRVSRLGGGYAIVVRVVDVDSSRVVLSVSDAAASQDQLIPVVSRVARRLREGLGERRSAVRASRELADMATPSFEAYRKSLRARQLSGNNDPRAVITVAREALALDPDFAEVWGQMGFAFGNLGERDSALAAFSEAFRRPGRLTERGQFNYRAQVARLEGDLQGAVALSDRAIEVDPNYYAYYNNRGTYLIGLGRPEEALASYRRAVEVSPFGPNQVVLSNMFTVLLGLGRLNEARQVARDLKGRNELNAATDLAVAEPNWVRAESLGIALETDLSAPAELRADGASSLAIAQAASGRIKAAAGALRRGQALITSRVGAEGWKRARLLLAQVTGDLARVPEDVRSRDSSTVVLTTQALWEAAAGDTARARRLLAAIRRRSAIELARQGSAPTLVEAWLAARAGRWLESAQMLAPAARQGDDVGDLELSSGRVLKRWLVAEAYERLGRPDSAAAYFELAISPIGDAEALGESRIAYSFGHRRCVLLYARMGRLEEARRHWDIFAATFTRPDPEMVPLVEEARAALVSAEGMAKSTRR